MAGIYGLVSNKQNFEDSLYQYFYSFNKSGILNEEYLDQNFTYGRSVVSKLESDRFLVKKEEIVIGFEGICYSHLSDNCQDEFLTDYKENGISFIENVEGQFCGFILDRSINKLFIFTDQLSTKPLYLYFNKEREIAFFSSELKAITKTLRKAEIPLSPDEDGFRCLLTCGYMLGDLTPIQEVKKLPYGCITTIELDNFELSYNKYFKIEKKKLSGSKADFINGIDERLKKAIKDEWNKDIEYQKTHFTFLSGGLDSRVNAMIGSSTTNMDVHSLTFSSPGTPDQKIAGQIAKDLKFAHTFIEMNQANYLIGNEYEFVKSNDGLVGYYGGAHQQWALQQIDLEEFCIVHSGQIGDVLFGSFIKSSHDLNESYKKTLFHADDTILNKIGWLNNMKEQSFNGADIEIFSIENRQINGTLNGDRCCAHLIDIGSPFYNKELLSFCLKIPDKFKKEQSIYLDWMEDKAPEMTSYKWAKTGTKPSAKLLYKLLGWQNRGKVYLYKKLGVENNNMNPYQSWYIENEEYRKSLQLKFDSRDLTGMDKELQHDIIYCFEKNNVISKMLAVTAILSFRLHFLD